jgi:CheY-like chemotaxis protein
VCEDVESASPSPIDAQLSGGNETILLVEDEPALRKVTASILQSAGYTVLEAENPSQAIEFVKTFPGAIHLLVTDIVMPNMNGVELSKQLNASRPNLKVMFISGYGGDQLARQLALSPQAVLVEKPFSRQTLLRKVHVLLHD